MPTLYLPKKGWTVWDMLKTLRDPGWKQKRVPGAYVAGDLVENQKCIILCSACKHGFDWKKAQYYSYAKYDDMYVTGRCDRCKAEGTKRFMYVHNSVLGQAGLTRRDTLRHRQRYAKIVG